VKSNSTAAGGGGKRSRRKLDRRTRAQVLRLAADGQPHPQPAVSLNAHQWASDRLQIPLRREIVIVLTGGLLGSAIILAVLLALHQNVGLLVVVALVGIAGMCGWTLYLRRRIEQVARVNHTP
jgi:Flp pilus assembly protein TadB